MILGGLGVEPELEAQLPLARRLQRAQDGAERRAPLEFGVHLADDGQVGEREVGLRVGAQRRADQVPLLEVVQVVLAQKRIHRKDGLYRVPLLAQRRRRRHAGKPTELVLREDPDAPWFARVDRPRPADLLVLPLLRLRRRAAVTWRRRGADDEHCRPGADIVDDRAAEFGDQHTRVLAADRRQSAAERDRLAGERRPGGVCGRGTHARYDAGAVRESQRRSPRRLPALPLPASSRAFRCFPLTPGPPRP